LNQMRSKYGKGWIDISVTLHNGMAQWPGDPEFRMKSTSDMEHGDSYSLSQISMGSHTGTHIDAPLHFIKNGLSINHIPLDTVVGRARVLEIKDDKSIKPDEVRGFGIQRGERILFKTRNSIQWQTDRFIDDFVFLSDEAADLLANMKVKVIGVDYLSVGNFKDDGSYPHRVLLKAGVWIIEGLDLSAVSPGKYSLICLPLKLEKGDGAPARAIVRPVRD
jgi:arylformamidase